jgi:hypothetical protein
MLSSEHLCKIHQNNELQIDSSIKSLCHYIRLNLFVSEPQEKAHSVSKSQIT